MDLPFVIFSTKGMAKTWNFLAKYFILWAKGLDKSEMKWSTGKNQCRVVSAQSPLPLHSSYLSLFFSIFPPNKLPFVILKKNQVHIIIPPKSLSNLMVICLLKNYFAFAHRSNVISVPATMRYKEVTQQSTIKFLRSSMDYEKGTLPLNTVWWKVIKGKNTQINSAWWKAIKRRNM